MKISSEKISEGKAFNAYLKGTGKPMGYYADLFEMTRQNLNYHLRKDALDRSFVRLVKEKMGIDVALILYPDPQIGHMLNIDFVEHGEREAALLLEKAERESKGLVNEGQKYQQKENQELDLSVTKIDEYMINRILGIIERQTGQVDELLAQQRLLIEKIPNNNERTETQPEAKRKAV